MNNTHRERLHRGLQAAAFLGAALVLAMVLYASTIVQREHRQQELEQTRVAQPTASPVVTLTSSPTPPLVPTRLSKFPPGWSCYVGTRIIESIVFDQQGQLWTAGMGVAHWDLDNRAATMYTVLDGLACNDILSAGVGSDGSLWFGTALGLSRFDGRSWRTYTTGNEMADILGALVIAPAADGTLWLRNLEGLSRFDGIDWVTYTLVTDDGRTVTGWPTTTTEGTLWVTAAPGVLYFDGQSWTFHHISPHAISLNEKEVGPIVRVVVSDGTVFEVEGAEGLTSPVGPLSSPAVAPDGSVWFRSDVGAVRLDGTSWTVHVFPAGPPCEYITPNDLAVAPDGIVWAASGDGAARFDGTSWSLFTATAGMTWTHLVTIGPDGTPWFGTWYGLLHFDGTSWTSYTDVAPPVEPIEDLAVAADGTLWLLARFGGLVVRFDGQDWSTYKIDLERFGYPSRITVAPDGSVWFGSMGGAVRFDGTGFAVYTIGPGVDYPTAFAFTPDGAQWVGTRAGLYRLDGISWTVFTSSAGLPADSIEDLVVARDGSLWVATPSGAAQYDGHLWTTYTTTDGLPDNRVTALAAAPDGSVWLGTEYGLAHFSGTTRRAYVALGSWAENRIEAIEVATDGSIWFRSADRGVNHFDGTNWTIYPVGYSASVAVAPDGTIWVGTYEGLFRYVPSR